MKRWLRTHEASFRHAAIFALLLIGIALDQQAVAQSRTGGSRNAGVHSQALSFFPHWIEGATPQTHDQTMRELLNLETPTQNWPPFPRTWLELSLERTESTTTAWVGNVSAFQGTVPVIGSFVNIGARAEAATQYRYGVTTSLIAISSLRPLRPEATANSEHSHGVLPTSQPPQGSLRTIVDWREGERRTYFNVTAEYPILALCKFEMTMKIARTSNNRLEFLVHQWTNEVEDVQTVTYAFYSNFFPVRADVPIQEYLRSTCDEEYQYLVRYLAEQEFNNVVREIYAHYHPEAQCTLPDPNEPLDPRGDASCMDWHRNPRYVMGSYRRVTVPRCVLGAQGIPRCVVRSKQNVSCPVYLVDGRLTPRRPQDGRVRLMNSEDHQHFPCDRGLSCEPARGGSWQDIELGWLGRFGGVQARCRANP